MKYTLVFLLAVIALAAADGQFASKDLKSKLQQTRYEGEASPIMSKPEPQNLQSTPQYVTDDIDWLKYRIRVKLNSDYYNNFKNNYSTELYRFMGGMCVLSYHMEGSR